MSARKQLWNENDAPFSLGNIILLKEKGGMRESVPRQVDRESRGPQGERGLEHFYVLGKMLSFRLFNLDFFIE